MYLLSLDLGAGLKGRSMKAPGVALGKFGKMGVLALKERWPRPYRANVIYMCFNPGLRPGLSYRGLSGLICMTADA